MKLPRPGWLDNIPKDLPSRLSLLKEKKHLLNQQGEVGAALRQIHKEIKETQERALLQAKKQQPLAFFQPSYEQSLILNSWMYGIGFNCIYSANRIGKTTACIINFLLWILPNVQSWLIFQPYIVGGEGDQNHHLNQNNPNKGKKVQVFRRPDISTFQLIQRLNKKRPSYIPAPNPRKSHTHPSNIPFLHWMQKQVNHHATHNSHPGFKSTYPAPPWNKNGTIWMGAPDHDHFEKIIMPLWRQYLPAGIIDRDIVASRSMTFVIPQPNSEVRKTEWEWVGKSYESKDTKWSSGAVDAIVLTEGILPSIWSEIKARFKDPGIGSHDFTPYEPANAGAATALAQKIKKGSEPVPLPYFVFEKFSVYAAPSQVMSQEKKLQLITSYENTPEGAARLDGEFYSSSALVLSNLSRNIHLLDWSIPELHNRYPTAQLYRGIDPGLDHPTACAWGALLPTNQWVIYRILCQPALSISQRAEKIVALSNNKLEKKRFGPRKEDFYLQEVHPNPNSEIILASPIDYHVFKQDEITGLNYSLNYNTAGLVVSESIHMGPEDRALKLDDLLKPNPFIPNLTTSTPPGARVYFLKNSPGVMAFILKMEEHYWDRKRSGEDKGAPKDKTPIHGDDELDAITYLTCSPFVWTSYRPPARLPNDSEPEPTLAAAATSLAKSRRGQSQSQNQNQNQNESFASNAKRTAPTPVIFGDPLNLNQTDEDEDPYLYNRY